MTGKHRSKHFFNPKVIKAVFFNTYYTAKYYIDYVETYLPEAGGAHGFSGFSVHFLRRKMRQILSSETQQTFALKYAKIQKTLEVGYICHADIVLVEKEISKDVVKNNIPGIVVLSDNDLEKEKGEALRGVAKRSRPEFSGISVDAVI